jgi:hypothetical protein
LHLKSSFASVFDGSPLPRLSFSPFAKDDRLRDKKVVAYASKTDLVWQAEGLAARGNKVHQAPQSLRVRNCVRRTLFPLAMRREPCALNALIESPRRQNPRTIPAHAPLCFQATATGRFNPAIFDSNCGHLSKSLTKFH